MPRPKRTKVASAKGAPTRVAKPSKPVAPPQPRLKEKKAPSPIDDFSDDSDGLVVRSRRPRVRMPWHPEPQTDVDFTMTGALPVPEQGQQEQEPETGSTRKFVRSPGAPLASRTPSSNVAEKFRRTRSSVNTPAPTSSPKQNPPADPSALDAPTQEEESSLLDPSLLTFGSLDSESPAHGTRPPSAMKVGGTPAHETSILALTNFRRRPRQPSLLRMVRQTTDVEDNDQDDLDDLDDFHPEAESTPLHVRTGQTAAEDGLKSGPSLPSSGSRGTKRKLSSPVIQVPRSSPPFHPPSGADIADSQRSTSPSLPDAVVPSCENDVEPQEQDPELMSETMAPPRSSSPANDNIEDSPANPRQRRTRAGSRKTRYGSDSDGEETDRPSKAPSKQRSKAQTISTAKLQALLPRRRTRVRRERDEYDIQSSDDLDTAPIDSDQDELQLPPPRASTARKTAKPSKKTGRAAKKTVMPTETAKKNTKTYARTSSDKENGSTFVANEDSSGAGEDEPTEISIDLPKTQLAAIAKKFEDVDAWEMEFESVDVDGDTSSPWR